MNTAEDIKRMLGELVDEAIRIGRAEGEKTLGTDAQLKEQVKRLVVEKQTIAQQRKALAEENNFLEDENEALKAKVDSYDGVSREQATEVVRLKEQVKELNEALAICRVPVPRDCPFCGFPAEVHQLRKGEWYVACGNGECPVNPETNCFDTETDAIEAWNNSYNAPKVTCDWR